MTSANPQDDLSARIDEAIAWHLRVTSDAAKDADWVALTVWLEADPLNRLAFDRVEDFEATVDLARESAQARDADSLSAFRPRPESGSRSRTARIWTVIAGGLLAASLVVAFLVRSFEPRAVEYATRIGESRTVALSDGSRIDINTDSRLLVQVDASSRHVTLERGEAIFHVARDAAHPFIVRAGDCNVRVTGTVFDVLNSDGAIAVAVAEGRVLVSRISSEREEVALLPGDQLIHDEGRDLTTVARINPADALAWRNGYLVYRNAPLSKVVNDLNRYFSVPIALAGDKTPAMRFSGVLRLDGESAVLKRMTRFLPIAIGPGPGQTFVLRDSAAKP
jgi:transmembrane sensor